MQCGSDNPVFLDFLDFWEIICIPYNKKIVIPVYWLSLHGLYRLYGPRCLLSPERLLNVITHSPLSGRSNILPCHISPGSAWYLVHIRSMLKYSTYMIINIDSIPHKLDYMVPEPNSYNIFLDYSQNHFIPQSNDCALQLCLFCADPSVNNLLYWIIHYCWWGKWHIFHLEDVSFSPPTLSFKVSYSYL